MLDESKPYMVRAEGLTKNFQLYANQTEKLKSTFMGNRAEANFWALRGLSFEIQAGMWLVLSGRMARENQRCSIF